MGAGNMAGGCGGMGGRCGKCTSSVGHGRWVWEVYLQHRAWQVGVGT